MGAEYAGLQLAVQRPVAIKVLKLGASDDDEVVRQLVGRFEREAVLTSRLEHPNTARLYDFGRIGEDVLFLVLELLKGRTLSEVVRHETPVDPRRAAHIGRQMCRSLAEAHARGIIHRDLKPANVFLCEVHGETDFVKVLDFGVARIVGGDATATTLTNTGAIVGTPRYMAPEQVLVQDLTPATDLYALGAIPYELLTGAPPFVADGIIALAFKHAHEPAPALPDHLGPEWQDLVARLLAKEPAARPASAEVVAEALARLEAGGTATRAAVVAVGGESITVETGGWTTAHTWTAAAVGVLVAASIIAGVTWWLCGSETNAAAAPPPPEPIAAVVEPEAVAEPEAEPDVVQDARPAPAAEPPAAEPLPLARLVLDSQPQGAAVMRGDETLCETPCDLDVPAGDGQETLVLQRRGYRDRELLVDLASGERVAESVRLTRKPTARAKAPAVAPAAVATPKPKPKPKPKPAEPSGLPPIR